MKDSGRFAVIGLLVAALLIVSAGAAGASEINYRGRLNAELYWDLENDLASLHTPFRLADLAFYSALPRGSWYLSGYADYMGEDEDVRVKLGEAYVEMYFANSDLRLGRQIIAWGIVDGNNPVDNLTPLDLNFIMAEPVERKIPVAAARWTSYWGDLQDLQAELVVIPEFAAHEMTAKMRDQVAQMVDGLPFRPATVDPDVSLGNPEIGLRFKKTLDAADLAFSYYRGHDRMATLDLPTKSFVYHPVEVIGGEIGLYNLGNITLRGEGAYFVTADGDGNRGDIRNPYWQYALEAEYAFDLLSSLVFQYLGSYDTRIDDQAEKDQEGQIPYKMGMPAVNLVSSALVVSYRKEFSDISPELKPSLEVEGLYDLEEDGYLGMAKVGISPREGWRVHAGIAFTGGDSASKINQELNSQLWTGVEFSF